MTVGMLPGQIILGIGFFLVGLIFFLLVWLLLRLVPRGRPPTQFPAEAERSGVQTHQDAILLVETGGHIRAINPTARLLFDLVQEETPNIERLARKVRPNYGLLEICAVEGQAHFSINGKLMQAVSYHLPGPPAAMLVAFRQAERQHDPDMGAPGDFSGWPLTTQDFGESLGASLDLFDTVRDILLGVTRLVTTDFIEIKTWDEVTKNLQAYRLVGEADALNQAAPVDNSLFGEFAMHLVQSRLPMLIADTRIAGTEKFDSQYQKMAPMGSYIGIPLLAFGRLVGTLEVGLVSANAFGDDDQSILQSIMPQIAQALRNSMLNKAQLRWNSQLDGISQLVRSVGGMQRSLTELFTHILAGIAPLFDVEIIGFLLYDEQRRVLAGHEPFQGLPGNVVAVYRTAVRPGSLLEKYIQSHELVSTPNFAQDAAWSDLDLQVVAIAASMRDTSLVPLSSAGRFLGYLQFSNHQGSLASFSPEDMRLLNIIASQVAVLVDNILLLQQNVERNQRVEAMRRITSKVSSPASMDEMLQEALREAGSLFQAEAGSIFMLDESAGIMRAHVPSAFGVPAEFIEPLSRLNVNPEAFRLTVAGSQRSFVSGDLARDRRVLPLYRAIVRKLNLVSAMVVPLVVQGKGIGEMMLGSLKPDFFGDDDLKIAVTIAGQLAVAIDHANHAGETDPLLRRRSEYMTVMNRIHRELNSTNNLRELTHIVYDASLLVSGAKCASVLLFDPKSTGPGDREVLFHAGHVYPGALSETGRQVSKTGQAQLLGLSATNMAPHAGICTSFIAPIGHQDEVFGLIELHSDHENAFDEISLEMLRIVGMQSALAVGAALRYIEQQNRTELFRRRAETLLRLFETSKNLRIDETLVSALGSIALGIQKATPFNVVLVSLYNAQTGLLTNLVSAGLDDATFANIHAHQQQWSSVSQLMTAEFELGSLYFIPFDKAPIIPADIQFLTTMKAAEQKPNAWNPDDILIIPIYDNDQKPLGLISVDDPRDGLHPDRIALETLEIFSSQAALVITNGLNAQDHKRKIENLTAEVIRQKTLVDFTQRSLPTLLHKDLEQSLALSQLIQRARHIRASLQVTEALSQQIDSKAALITLGRQLLTGFEMSVTIIATETVDGPHIAHVFGNLPPGVNPETSFGQRNPLRICLQTGETIVSENLDEDETWHDTPFLTNLRAKSFICLPVVINGQPIAAVLAVDTQAMPALSVEDRQIYSQVSKQVSIILQNMSLLNETRQRLQEVNLLLAFSRQLSGLNSSEILRSLLQSALRVVAAAHAGVVFLYDLHDDALVPLAAANYVDDDSIRAISYRSGEGLPGRVIVEKSPRRLTEVDFVSEYNLSPENLLLYRKATGGRLPVASVVLPILAGDRLQGALVLDNFNTPGAFRAEDEAILLSLTQQVSLSLENVRLVQATQERSGQLSALNAVSATLTSSLKRDDLVATLLERLSTIISFDTAILWLRQENRMVVADARGFDDNEDRKGLVVAVADSVLLDEMTRTGQPIVVDDVRSDQRFSSLIQARYLAWMGIPLITQGKVMAVLALEKSEAHYYDSELLQLATTFASQAAIAMDNATLFEESVRRAAELDERSQRLAILNKFSSELGGSLSSEQVLNLATNQLVSALGVDRAMLILLGKDQRNSLLSVYPEESGRPNIYRSLSASPALDYLRETQSVYLSENRVADANLGSLADILEDVASLLILSLAGSEKLFAILLTSAIARRFTPVEIELARTISNQASIALDNADLYQATFDTAQRLAILNQVSFEIGASLNEEDIYRAAHQATTHLMPADAFVIALEHEPTGDVDGVYVVDNGQRIIGVRVTHGEGLSGQVVASGQPMLILEPSEVDARGGVTISDRGTPHSIVAVPMLSGGKAIGSISAQSYQFNAYTESDQQILSTIANQVTVALINARLFAETHQLAATLEQRVTERTAQLEHEQHNTETLLRILTEVTASLDLDRALSRTLALLNDAVGAEQGMIMLLNTDDGRLHYRAGYDSRIADPDPAVQDSRITNQLSLRIGEGLSEWVMKNRTQVVVSDLRRDNRVGITLGILSQRSALVVPLVVGEDLIGTIMVMHHRVGFFSEAALDMVKAIGSQVSIAINNARLYELISDQADRLGAMLRQQQMEASRQTAILEAVADGILVTDSANSITFVNDSVERILDVNKDRMEDQTLEHFAGLFGKNTQAWIGTVNHWSQNPGSTQLGEMYAEQITLDNGRVALVHLTPVVWHDEFLGTVSIFRDITHEVELDRLKSEFVATVSHELRTPMTSIRGYVDLLLKGAAGVVTEQQVRFLEVIRSNTERLNFLVSDLLDLSQIEAGRVNLSIDQVDLQQVAAEAVNDLEQRSAKEKKPMQVTLDVEKSLPQVMADPAKLRQILGNLLDNAYNYTPAQGKISVCLHKHNDNIQVDVIDNGIGVSQEQHARIFERFYRGENSMVLATPGTGLGLSIVKQLVEMHHGKIWLESPGIAGHGSTFSFTIPASEKQE